jgi:hypothetical protein
MNKTHGMSNTVEYRIYKDAKRRCVNREREDYPLYGGRGIEFKFSCFEDFYAELGDRPKGRTLDRIDNSGHYEPGNVQWSTPRQQARNRRPKTLNLVCKRGHPLTNQHKRRCSVCRASQQKERYALNAWVKALNKPLGKAA